MTNNTVLAYQETTEIAQDYAILRPTSVSRYVCLAYMISADGECAAFQAVIANIEIVGETEKDHNFARMDRVAAKVEVGYVPEKNCVITTTVNNIVAHIKVA